jgi:hypothetical protein
LCLNSLNSSLPGIVYHPKRLAIGFRENYGWGIIAGITSASLFLRPDIERARKNKAIERKDILKHGILGVHMFDIRDKAKAYFKARFVFEPLQIAPEDLQYLQSLINSAPQIDACSICICDMTPSSTTVTLPCSHVFCYDCVQELARSWVDRDEAMVLECPNCRAPISKEMVEQSNCKKRKLCSSSSGSSSSSGGGSRSGGV